jgi:hypothetical protein
MLRIGFFNCIVVLSLLLSCKSEKSVSTEKYPRWVGDIAFDPSLDDASFHLCREEYSVKQYFNMNEGVQFEGEKAAIDSYFHSMYKRPENSSQSGLIRIRFMVNCKGETGRFRLISSNNAYKPMKFSTEISDQLLELTKELKGWKPMEMNTIEVDYYQYLVFRIVEGEITEILP